jgi:dTDP-4-amino-4,6-dideoxygalactose transaminase
MFYILMPTHSHQIGMLSHLKSHGIGATFHYIPLHTSSIGHKLGYKDSDLPISLDTSRKIVRLPVFSGLLRKDVDFIVKIVKKYKL